MARSIIPPGTAVQLRRPRQPDVIVAEIIEEMPATKDLILSGRAALADLGRDPDDWVDADTDAQAKRGTPQNTLNAIHWGWGRWIWWCGRTGRNHLPGLPASVRQYIKDHWEMRDASGRKRGRYGQPYAPQTVELAVYIVSMVHQRFGFANPVAHPLVGEQLDGYRVDFEAAGFRTDESDPITLAQSVTLARSQNLATVNGLRNATMFRVQFDTGCRAAELCHIQIQDVAWPTADRALITFTRTKTKKARTVAVQATPDIDPDVDPCLLLLAWYRAVLAAGHKAPGPLFREVQPDTAEAAGVILEQELSRSAYERAFNRAVARSKIAVSPVEGAPPQHITTHSNRSGLITALADAGQPLEKVAKRTGHSPASKAIHDYFRSDRKWDDDNMGVFIRRASQPAPPPTPQPATPEEN